MALRMVIKRQLSLILFLLLFLKLIDCRRHQKSLSASYHSRSSTHITSSSRCRDKGDVAFGDICYRFIESTEPVTYEAASNYCLQLAGNKTLAVIASKREQLFLANYLESRGWADALIGLRLVRTPWKWIAPLGTDDNATSLNFTSETREQSLLNGQGCFGNTKIDASNSKYSNRLTIQGCIEFCREKNRPIAGVQASTLCLCADRLPSINEAAFNCTMKCSGDPNQLCGNHRAVYYYNALPTNRSLFSGDNWAPSRPATDGNCAASMIIDKQHSAWLDLACQTALPFVCQFERLADSSGFLNWPTNAIVSSAKEKGFCTEIYCYLLFPRVQLNFAAANKFCSKRGIGGRLVRIDSVDEQVIINRLVISPSPNARSGNSAGHASDNSVDLGNTFRFWIGASRLEFRWANGQPLRPGFAAWAEDTEPAMAGEETANCVRMSSFEGSYMWKVRTCEDLPGSKTFICSGPSLSAELSHLATTSNSMLEKMVQPVQHDQAMREKPSTRSLPSSTVVKVDPMTSIKAMFITTTALPSTSSTSTSTTTPKISETTSESVISTERREDLTLSTVTTAPKVVVARDGGKTTTASWEMEYSTKTESILNEEGTTLQYSTRGRATSLSPPISRIHRMMTTRRRQLSTGYGETRLPKRMRLTTSQPTSTGLPKITEINFKRRLNEVAFVEVFTDVPSPPRYPLTTALSSFEPESSVAPISRLNVKRQTEPVMTTLLASATTVLSSTHKETVQPTFQPSTADEHQTGGYSSIKPILVSLTGASSETTATPLTTDHATTQVESTNVTVTEYITTTTANVTLFETTYATDNDSTTTIVSKSFHLSGSTMRNKQNFMISESASKSVTELSPNPPTTTMPVAETSLGATTERNLPNTTLNNGTGDSLANLTTVSPVKRQNQVNPIAKHINQHAEAIEAYPELASSGEYLSNRTTNSSGLIDEIESGSAAGLESLEDGDSKEAIAAPPPDFEHGGQMVMLSKDGQFPFSGGVMIINPAPEDDSSQGADKQRVDKDGGSTPTPQNEQDASRKAGRKPSPQRFFWWHILIAVLLSIAVISLIFSLCYCYLESVKQCLLKPKRQNNVGRRITPSSSNDNSHRVTPEVSCRDDTPNSLQIVHAGGGAMSLNFTSISCAALKRLFQLHRTNEAITQPPQSTTDSPPNSRRPSAPYRVWQPGSSRVAPGSGAENTSSAESSSKPIPTIEEPKLIDPKTEQLEQQRRLDIFTNQIQGKELKTTESTPDIVRESLDPSANLGSSNQGQCFMQVLSHEHQPGETIVEGIKMKTPSPRNSPRNSVTAAVEVSAANAERQGNRYLPSHLPPIGMIGRQKTHVLFTSTPAVTGMSRSPSSPSLLLEESRDRDKTRLLLNATTTSLPVVASIEAENSVKSDLAPSQSANTVFVTEAPVSNEVVKKTDSLTIPVPVRNSPSPPPVKTSPRTANISTTTQNAAKTSPRASALVNQMAAKNSPRASPSERASASVTPLKL